MIRYYEPGDVWVSNINLDETGMPSTDLDGEVAICLCTDCEYALEQGKGKNFYILFSDEYPKRSRHRNVVR